MYGLFQPNFLGWKVDQNRNGVHTCRIQLQSGSTLAKNVIQISVLSDRGKELSNRSLAVAEAARRPNIKDAPMKAVEQQGLQAIQRSRYPLIQGALADVHRMKEPRTSKDRWLKDLIEQAGPRRAAVVLANKNVRTAWAFATQGTEYQRREQLEMAAWNVLQT